MFKYYNITGKNLHEKLDLLEKLIGSHASLMFSFVGKFNDPFELKFNLTYGDDLEKHRDFFFNHRVGAAEEDFQHWKKQVSSKYPWYEEQMIRDQLAQDLTFTCFTSVNNNNLMWSHYTNNHQGICVEYKKELVTYLQLLESYLTHKKVNYSKIPPIVSIFDPVETIAAKLLFNKQKEWDYEIESRFVLKSQNNFDFIPVSNYIKAVYMGARIPNDVKKHIIDVCNSRSLELYQGIALGSTYNVTFEKYRKNHGSITAFWK